MQIGEYNFVKHNFQLIENIVGRPAFLKSFSGKLGLSPVSEVITENYAQSLRRFFPQQPVFTLWFHPDEDGVYRGGIFSFGGIHEYRYVGPLVYLPLVSPNSWMVRANKIALGQNVICRQDCNIQFNTTVPYFYGPQQELDLINAFLQVEGSQMSAGVYLLDCDNPNTYPLLHIQFDTLDVCWGMDELWEKKTERSRTICKSGIRTSTDMPGWVFGHKLMYKLFTVFHTQLSKMGFARANHP
ncbi:pregnancy-associated glycoprotein [Clonorchis sinensis]|uniref:Pregnancy-associated glycoprotein n=1 Tax=Clonorchis sinensis TaxID=79923 RepID=G7YIU9_CLOSI|nr:pregnancy-associated glycoprotein [Clonorchis sinensis]